MRKQHHKKPRFPAVRRKWNSHGGFSYLEMLMVVFILSLCTGVISDTLALGVRHLQERTKYSQAIMLYDTLSAVVQNDLTYATGYASKDSNGQKQWYFKSNAKDIENLKWVQYGTGNWDANQMVQAISAPNVMDWQYSTSSGQRAQIIRKGKTYGTDPFYYYTPLTSSQDYSGKGIGGITSKSPLYATIEIRVENEQFKVTISVYDSLTATEPLMSGDELTVIPIGTLDNSIDIS